MTEEKSQDTEKSIFEKLLERMQNMHDKKKHDYTSDEDPYGNYRFAGKLASLFIHSPDDMGFVGRLGEKIFRLAMLEGNKKNPLNESIEDTEIDICVIACLWVSSRIEKRRRYSVPFTNPTTIVTPPIKVPTENRLK